MFIGERWRIRLFANMLFETDLRRFDCCWVGAGDMERGNVIESVIVRWGCRLWTRWVLFRGLGWKGWFISDVDVAIY